MVLATQGYSSILTPKGIEITGLSVIAVKKSASVEVIAAMPSTF